MFKRKWLISFSRICVLYLNSLDLFRLFFFHIRRVWSRKVEKRDKNTYIRSWMVAVFFFAVKINLGIYFDKRPYWLGRQIYSQCTIETQWLSSSNARYWWRERQRVKERVNNTRTRSQPLISDAMHVAFLANLNFSKQLLESLGINVVICAHRSWCIYILMLNNL